MQDREIAILKVTEDMIRDGGYNGFSFRNIADVVGIKSSSVHYHFATKEDLAVEVTKHYTDKFLSALGEPRQHLENGRDPIEVYIAAFRHALIEDRRMCLCGMLAAEIEVLPESVAAQVKTFFNRNVEWLAAAYTAKGESSPVPSAIQALSLLEGAMITSNAMGDIDVFDSASQILVN